jgi:hypothetical protein
MLTRPIQAFSSPLVPASVAKPAGERNGHFYTIETERLTPQIIASLQQGSSFSAEELNSMVAGATQHQTLPLNDLLTQFGRLVPPYLTSDMREATKNRHQEQWRAGLTTILSALWQEYAQAPLKHLLLCLQSAEGVSLSQREIPYFWNRPPIAAQNLSSADLAKQLLITGDASYSIRFPQNNKPQRSWSNYQDYRD